MPYIQMTDAILASSSVVEVAPAAYAAATTYAKDATCSVGNVGQALSVYRSLAAGNVGRTPATSPDWWQLIGTTYGAYSSTVKYALGALVIDPVNHRVYESAIEGNLGKPLVTGTDWIPRGATNRWAPFDRIRNTQALTPVDQVYVLAPGQRVTSIALIALDATAVTVSVVVDGAEVYKHSANLVTRTSFGWRDFFYGRFTTRKTLFLSNLPPYRNAQIIVTISKKSGMRGVGGILIGNAIYIGDTQFKPVSDHLNFSIIERDEFGNITLVPHRSVPVLSQEIWFSKEQARRIFDLRSELNGVPAIYSCLDDNDHPYFDPLFMYGIHKRFAISLEGPEHGTINLEVEEL